MTFLTSPKAQPEDKHRFTEVEAARRFVLAGAAYLTFVSGKTGARFTYLVSKGDEAPYGGGAKTIHFVHVLAGPDNGRDYMFLGVMFDGGVFRVGRRCRVSPGSPSLQAFTWLWNDCLSKGHLPPGCEVWHEGRCGRCGHRLTVPESIASGLGPVCAEREPFNPDPKGRP